MFNIPYILKNVIKERLENRLKSFSDNIINAITDCLMNSENNHKYVSIIADIQKETKELIVKVISDIFETLDQQYFESKNRKLFYESNKLVSRTITTIFGEVTFNRHYYKSKIDGSYHFVLDEALGLPKHDKYDPIVKALSINTYSKTNMALSGKIIGEQLQIYLISLLMNLLKLFLDNLSIIGLKIGIFLKSNTVKKIPLKYYISWLMKNSSVVKIRRMIS